MEPWIRIVLDTFCSTSLSWYNYFFVWSLNFAHILIEQHTSLGWVPGQKRWRMYRSARQIGCFQLFSLAVTFRAKQKLFSARVYPFFNKSSLHSTFISLWHKQFLSSFYQMKIYHINWVCLMYFSHLEDISGWITVYLSNSKFDY